ncbi:coiled-coil domain-containing protein 96 isoform X2 [Octopus bimaculoides]|uniref:coiled-coil domain-containing protein 96 isoform X2 n=1 Tax=Octopus bimaculoides TaxID=37653 RepID=UPI00071D193E|nr:coiled-coil domain-containing protein 96 isoform X2 [Octopus bimaculoides]|eukprot:XP_014772864.1 PREDICTED: coiled-coil domain-containing protein 96-like isoform X2 [Octopus bimaculoides]
MADETKDVSEGMSETDPSHDQNEENLESKQKEAGEEGHAESSTTPVAAESKPDNTEAEEMASDAANVKEIKDEDVNGTVDGAAVDGAPAEGAAEGVEGAEDDGGGGGGVVMEDGGGGGVDEKTDEQLVSEEGERKEAEAKAEASEAEEGGEQPDEPKATSQIERAEEEEAKDTEMIEDQTDEKQVKEGEEGEAAAAVEEVSTGVAETEAAEGQPEGEKRESEKEAEEAVIGLFPTEAGEMYATKDGIPLNLEDMMDLDMYQQRLEIGETPIAYEEDLEQTHLEAYDYEQKRDMLMARYQAAINVLEELQVRNSHIQQKLAEFFKKKKADDTHIETKSNADQEERYLKLMAQIEDLQEQEIAEKDRHYQYIEDLKQKCSEKKEKVDSELMKLYEFKKEVATCAINSRTGQQIPKMDVEQYLEAEKKRQTEVSNIRLENIKLKNKLKKKEQQLKSTEELAEGLHLIDFEQLKIENQTYNEKIEERNEELQKLKKKIKSTVEVLTHLKEKLQFMKLENKMLGEELNKVELAVVQKRDRLNNTKQGRDYLKNDNQALQRSCGLLNNKTLLYNFEVQKDESEHLLQEVENLKLRYTEFNMNSQKLQKKIAAAEYQKSLL